MFLIVYEREIRPISKFMETWTSRTARKIEYINTFCQPYSEVISTKYHGLLPPVVREHHLLFQKPYILYSVQTKHSAAEGLLDNEPLKRLCLTKHRLWIVSVLHAIITYGQQHLGRFTRVRGECDESKIGIVIKMIKNWYRNQNDVFEKSS